MKRIYIVLAILFSISTLSSGQLVLDEATTNDTAMSFVFCMPLAEYTDSIVYLKCGDIKMEIKTEEFHGQMTIVIIPNEENGPITEKRTYNRYMLPKE